MIAIPAVLAASVASAAPAAADSLVCSYFPAGIFPPFVTAAVTPNDGFAAGLYATGGGTEIGGQDSSGSEDCGAATMTNTALIAISDASTGGAGAVGPFYIAVGDGAEFAPGFGDEPGSSDEIEFGIGLGPGRDNLALNSLHVDEAATIRMGASGDKQYINLNSDETTGIDQDVTMTGVDSIAFYAFTAATADDDVRGTGGKGTGSAPIPVRIALEGGGGDDTLAGGTRSDDINGGTGDDSLQGLGAQDFLNGRAGRDLLLGGRGKDFLTGGTDKDRLFGGGGRDLLSGKAQNDRLVAGAGKDVLYGGLGRDVCVGGGGADKFVSCEVKIG